MREYPDSLMRILVTASVVTVYSIGAGFTAGMMDRWHFGEECVGGSVHTGPQQFAATFWPVALPWATTYRVIRGPGEPLVCGADDAK